MKVARIEKETYVLKVFDTIIKAGEDIGFSRYKMSRHLKKGRIENEKYFYSLMKK